MTISQSFMKLLRCGLIAVSCFGASPLAYAEAPGAVNDNLTSSPVNQNQTKTITEATLIANDTGDGKNIKSVNNSAAGAAVSWNNGSKVVTYDPRTVATFIALGSGASLNDTFTYVLGGTDGPDSMGTVTVRVDGVNDSPAITGMSATALAINDKNTTSTPFAGVTITDPDTNDTLTVTVTITSAANGSFASASGVTDNGNGTYTITGSASVVQTRVRALVFVPVENRITPGNSDNTTLTVSVSDGIASPVSASRTVNITSVNDAPVVNTGANRNMNDNASLAIFSNVSFSDSDVGQNARVTVTFNANKGSFSGGTFDLSGPTPNRVLTLPTQNFASAQAALRALVFTPSLNQVKVGSSENLSFSIQVSDGTASANGSLTVSVLSVNDPPVLAPATVGPFTASAGSTITPFANVTLTDDDFDDTSQSGDIENPAGDSFTATITLNSAPPTSGAISSSSFVIGSAANSYVYTGTRSQVETAIKSALYLAPASAGTFQIKLSVKDSSGQANDTSNEITASVTVTQPNPGMSGLVFGQELADNAVIFPFASAAFNNFGGTDRLVEIRLDSDAKGAFDNLGPFIKSPVPAPFVYRMTGNSVTATDAIRGLRFRPTPNRITGASETVTFTVLIKTATGEPDRPALSTDPLTVTVTSFNDAPTISGSNPDIRINDDETATPFATMGVADPDEGGLQLLTVTVTLIGSNPDTNAPLAGGGTLGEAPGADVISGVTFTPTGTYPEITYTIVGNPENVTAFLKALVFTPKADRNAVGKRETIRFTVNADDQKGGTAQNTNTTVIVTSVNGAPKISDVPDPDKQPFAVPASGNGMVMPFAALGVTDEDDEITFTIALDVAAKGSLSTDDFSSTVAGIYTMSGTPTAITAALKSIVYTLSTSYEFPSEAPGLTTFTLTASDSTNTSTAVFTIFIRERNLAHIVTSTADSGTGSLRDAIGFAGNGDMIVFDFPAEDFPVTIALESPLIIEKNLSVIGSGVDQLTISGQGSTGLFSVVNAARLTVEQLTFKDGAAGSYGGAIAVNADCALIARYCEFSGNTADQYGGAIDVFDGELIVENCLFLNNAVTGSIAGGGGAISLYTSLPSSITNSTFIGNRQENGGSAVGGGALYAQNADLAQFFNLQVEHCTFLDNDDAKAKGSAILSAAAGMKARLRNNIFADDQGPVLDVLGGGRFVSLGGNIATDATETTYTESPGKIILLNHLSDKPSTTVPMLDDLADNSGATRTLSPKAAGPAIDTAVTVIPASDALGTDQRGFWRGTSPRDVGAAEAGAFKRVNINEIFVGGGVGTDFIEFYNPRDSETLDMVGLTLWIDGSLEHTFVPEDLTPELTPGKGFAWFPTVDLDAEKGRIELRNSNGQRILLVDYIASFGKNGVELATTGQSINRYPRYEGGFLPHQRVVERITGVPDGDKTSPGNDVDGSELGGGNAPPIAVLDADSSFNPVYEGFANQSLNPNVLANDIEFDRTDTLKITEVMPLTTGSVVNAELFAINGSGTIAFTNLPADLDTTISPMGASVTINSDKQGITYDPSASPTMIALSKGETITDIWAYTIRDHDESDTPQSRGDNAARQEGNIIKATTWFSVTVTGVNEAPEPMEDFAATRENQAIRLLADAYWLAPAVFDFIDLPENFKDSDSMGNAVFLPPPAPTISLLANDDDVDGDDDKTTLLIGAVHTTDVPTDTLVTTSELGATVKLDIRADRRETSIVYDPRLSKILNSLSEGEIATDSFYYSVFDRHGDRGVAKVTITITGVNDVPMARDDGGFVVNENSTLAISGAGLLANDTDPDQDENDPDDVLTIVVPFTTESSLGASLSFDGTTITYDPRTIEVFESLARNETLTDTFTYTITDAMGGTSTATVTVIVEGRNDAPVAADDLLKILENQTAVVNAAAGLLANDVDVDINGTPPDDDPWVLPQRNFTTPMGANLTINPDGSFRYDANSAAIDSLKQGELAVENFPYTVIDNFRTTASDDTFKVFANSENIVLPVLLNDVVAGTSPTAIMAYRADTEDPTKLVIESPGHALRDGLIIRIEGHTGAGNYDGVYPITSIDRDHFSVNIPFVNDASGNRGTWVTWFAITAKSSADKGGVISFGDGQSMIYSPTPGFYGMETFTYTIEDGVGGQDVAKVAVEVILPQFNGFLSASNDRFQVGMGSSGVAIDVLANDGILPANGASLTITGTVPISGASGNVEILNNGKTLAYTPADPAFTGTESFSYTVSGGGSDTAVAMVTFEVVDRSNLLDGNEDDFFVVVGSSNNLLDVLANDPALPAYPVTSTLIAVNGSATGGPTSSGGTVAISGDKLSYKPPASILTDTFTYTSRDASGATTTKDVRVRVVTATANFHAINDHYIVTAGSGVVNLPVLLNDGIVQNPGAALSIVNVGLDTQAPPDVSRVAIANGNSIRYTPPVGATTETFTYETSIGTLERREATITITVIDSFKTKPAPKNDFFHVAKNSGPHTLDVLKNDIPYPAAGWQWKIIAKTSPNQGGTLDIIGGTALSYKPVAGFFGIETFSYAIEDISNTIYTATVTVKVGGMITAPDHFAVLEDSSLNSLPVLANDDLLDTDAKHYTISAVTPLTAAGGAVAIAGSGPDNLVLYTPLPGFAGEDSFTYTVVDRSGGTRDETVTVLVIATNADRDDAVLRVEITGVNDLPILTGTANGAITDKQTIKPFAAVSITDLDEAGNQQQTVIVSFNSSFGTIVAPGMTRLSAGVYRRIGTPAQVTTSLRGIVFTPYENFIDYIDPGQADVVFNLSITDGYIPTPILSATTITVTPVNDAPIISSPIPDMTYHVNAYAQGIYLPLHFADVDDDVRGGQLTWTVTGNTNPALFSGVTINPDSRLLVLIFAADQPGVSDITVRGTDRGLLFVETTFRVTVEGPPVIVLAEGQTKPPAAAFVSGSQSGFRRDYRQSFRVMNPGTLPVSAFIVHVSDLNQPVDGITVHAAAFTTNENGTPANLQDDAVSSVGVNILRQSTYVYDVKYDVLIPPGESVVVHLTYRVSSVDLVSIRPTIRISLSTPDFSGEVGISKLELGAGREVKLTFNIRAGRDYRLEYSPDMTVWSPWLTPVPKSDFSRAIQFIDDGLNTGLHPSESPKRFYRLAELPAP